LEVFFPENHDPMKARVPCILLFHGGGWGNGDKKTFYYDCKYFASRGIVAATANYYMHTKEERQKLPDNVSRKTACVTDAKSAIRWMKEHAGELGIDPEKIVVGGGSAGGHVSLLSTLNPGNNDPADSKEFDTSIVAYVLFNPALSEGDVEYPEINALNYLRKDFPPAIVFFGTKDKWKKGWDVAHTKLKKLGAGNRVRLWLAEGEEHAFFNKQPWKDLTIIEADRFLTSLGLLKGKPTLKAPAGGAHYTKE
jgi:acetyl esterase/lipase